MQCFPSGLATVVSFVTLATILAAGPGCGGDEADTKSSDKAATPADKAPADKAEPGDGGTKDGGDKADTKSAGENPDGDGGTKDGDNPDTGPVEAAPEAPEEDLVPALFEQVKSLDTDDETATKALADAIAAGAAKLDAAKVANERGEALMTKGESERAEPMFEWARDAHKLYADPVYNLAKLAAYAGDLEIAKEHLQELEKRGNKKLMKKVGVEPAFAPLHDDPDVRKIYEQ